MSDVTMPGIPLGSPSGARYVKEALYWPAHWAGYRAPCEWILGPDRVTVSLWTLYCREAPGPVNPGELMYAPMFFLEWESRPAGEYPVRTAAAIERDLEERRDDQLRLIHSIGIELPPVEPWPRAETEWEARADEFAQELMDELRGLYHG